MCYKSKCGDKKLVEENYKIGKYKRVLFYSVMFALLLAFLLGQHIYPSERDNVDEENLL